MSKLMDMMQSMGENAELEQAFQADPKAVMDRFELSTEERAAVESGDAAGIRELAGLRMGGKTNKTVKSYA